MDDLINIENLKKTYQIVDDSLQSLDNKSVQMISIIGVMFTIQVTILPNNVSSFGSIFLIFSLIAYFFSAALFIKSCITREHKFHPTPKTVCHHYEDDVDIDEYISEYIGEGIYVINCNLDMVKEKGIDSKFGFYFFALGLLLTLLTVISVVIK